MDHRKINKLSREEKLRLLDLIEEKKRRLRESRAVYVPNDGQRPVHSCKKRIRAVFSGNGCWAVGTMFRMADGSLKRVEDIVVGDQLMGPDSTPRTVLKLYQGEEELFEISPSRSEKYIVNKSHTLSLKSWARNGGQDKEKIYEEVKVADFINRPEWKQRVSYLWRPNGGVEYPNQRLPIDPYFFGAWIGDGTSANTGITTMDVEVKDAVYQMAVSNGCTVRDYQGVSQGQSHTYTIRGEHGINPVLRQLRQLGVLKNKHIPDIYLKSSKEQRLQLLAGLIDTDGYLDNKGNIEITQVREHLTDQIRELVNSLGVSCSKKLKVVNNINYYRLTFDGCSLQVPCRIPRKQININTRQRDYSQESFKIRPIGIGEFFGFQVDKDNLILHADYRVDRNSGKTALAVNEAIWAAQGYNPVTEEFTKVPAKITIVLDRPEKVDEVYIPEFKKWLNLKQEQLHKDGRHYISRITFDNGSQIRFMFHLQEPMAFESIETDFALMDEPPPRPIFIALMRGGRTKGRRAKFLIVGTPIAGSWLREDVYDPWVKGELPDTECFRFGTVVNQQNLSDGYIEDFSRHLSEKERRIRLHGEFFDLDGLALAHLFKRHTHVIDNIDVDKIDNCVVAIDPHPNKAHVAILIGVDTEGYLYVIDEYESRETPRVFARSLKKLWWDKYKLFDIVCDSLGSTAMTGGEGNKSFIQVLNEEGVRARPTTFEDKDDESWIIRIQNALATPEETDNFGRKIPKLRLLSRCIKTIHDIETVSWQRYKNMEEYKPKLDISSKDYLAALKYGLASNLMPGRKKTKVWRRTNLKKVYR